MYNDFVDFKQAFDSVWQEGLLRTMRNCSVPEELVVLIEDIYMYGKSRSAIRVEGELTSWFQIKVGVRVCGLFDSGRFVPGLFVPDCSSLGLFVTRTVRPTDY